MTFSQNSRVCSKMSQHKNTEEVKNRKVSEEETYQKYEKLCNEVNLEKQIS